MDKNQIKFRTFQDTDVELFATWLQKDYILKWYHDSDDWLQEISERNRRFSWIHHYVVMDSEIPIGFCQYYDCYDAKDLEDWYEVIGYGETISIDYLIGNENYLGKGYGKEIVRLLTEHIRNTGNVHEIIVQPDEKNNASKGVLMANGYTYDEQKKYYRKQLN